MADMIEESDTEMGQDEKCCVYQKKYQTNTKSEMGIKTINVSP